MPDGTDNDKIGEGQEAPPPPAQPEYPVDRLKQRVGGVLAGRPLAVYLVLFAGAATLIILLIIVWISATGGGNEERPICTTISIPDARSAVLSGHVQRIAVLVDADNPAETLTGINLDFDDGSCRATVQGADHRDELYLVLGAVTYYNNYAENRVRIEYQKQAVQPELLSTSTSTATAAPPATETPTASPQAVQSPAATPEPTKPPATATAVATVTVQPTITPTATATARPSPTHTPTPEATKPPGP
jgi:cell division septation protein DedD